MSSQTSPEKRGELSEIEVQCISATARWIESYIWPSRRRSPPAKSAACTARTIDIHNRESIRREAGDHDAASRPRLRISSGIRNPRKASSSHTGPRMTTNRSEQYSWAARAQHLLERRIDFRRVQSGAEQADARHEQRPGEQARPRQRQRNRPPAQRAPERLLIADAAEAPAMPRTASAYQTNLRQDQQPSMGRSVVARLEYAASGRINQGWHDQEDEKEKIRVIPERGSGSWGLGDWELARDRSESCGASRSSAAASSGIMIS